MYESIEGERYKPHKCDRVCHLCHRIGSIFCFQDYYINGFGTSIYVCHGCGINAVKAQIGAKGLHNVNPLSTVSGPHLEF